VKSVSPVQRLLIAILVLASAAWLVDRLTGSAQPRTAEAAPAQATPGQRAAAWEDINALVACLTDVEYQSVADELGRLERDLFAPPDEMLGAPLTIGPGDPADAPAQAPPAAPFAERHVLQGVILGASPLAVIDDQLLGLNAVLEEHRLVQIHRDYVVLEHIASGAQVILQLAPSSVIQTRAP
jgi:hypothetical protein